MATAGGSAAGRWWKRMARPRPADSVSTSRMWSAISDARFSDGAGMMSTVSVRGRLLRASSRLPASIIGAKWPTPQTGTKTTVGSALVMPWWCSVRIRGGTEGKPTSEERSE